MIKNLLLGSSLSFFISFITLIVSARLFPLEFVADIKAVTLYGSWIAIVMSFQLHHAFLYYHNKETVNTQKLQLITINLLMLSAVLASITFAILFKFFYDISNFTLSGLVSFSVNVGFNLLFITSPTIFYSLGFSNRLPAFVFSFTSSNLIALLITYIFKLDINGYAFLQCALLFVAIIISNWRKLIIDAFKSLNKNLFEIPKDYFRYAKNVSISSFFESLADKVDKFFSSVFLSKQVFAQYSVLCFENPLVNILLSSYGIALVKKYKDIEKKNFKEFYKYWSEMIRIITFFTFPIAAFLFLKAEWFVSFIFGERYIEQTAVFKIYIIIAFLRFAPFQILLKMNNLVRYNILISLFFLLMSIIICSLTVLLELNGYYFAFGYLGGWFIYNLTAIYLVKKHVGLDLWALIPVHILLNRIMHCSFAVLVLIMNPYTNPLVDIVLFATAYILVIFIFDKTMREEILNRVRGIQ